MRVGAVEVVKGLSHDQSLHFAAGTAFRATLAIFPLVLGLVSLLSELNLGRRAGEVLGNLGDTGAVPGKSTSALEGQLNNLAEPGDSNVLVAIIAFGLALWSGAAAFRTIMAALNRALDLKERRSLRRRFGVSLCLATLTALLAAGATLLVALGPAIEAIIRDAPGSAAGWFTAWQVVKWPLVALLFFLWLAATYAWGPATARRFRLYSPGIAVAFGGWLAFAPLFSWYVDQIGDQGKLYGTFAGLIVFQLYVYWSALIVLIGAEVDCAFSNRGGDSAA